jgi:UDP-arabinose 4-epimerase
MEDMSQLPINPYGHSKLFVERILASYGDAYALRWMALRYFNASGADADAEIGEMHDPETHLIPLAIASALRQGRPLDLFGTDYPTPDGTAIRDYIHVNDLAAAHVAALRFLLDGGSSGPLNLGTGDGHSVRAIIETVGKTVGRAVEVRETARRPGDPPVLIADPRRAQRLLGWKPRHSDLDTIIGSAHRWYVTARQR